MQRVVARQLDVHRQTVVVEPRFGRQSGAAARHQLQVDITPEIMDFAQCLGDAVHLLLSEIGGLDDAGGEEQALDIVALVEVQREADHLVHAEAGAGHVAGDPVHAIDAVVDAEIGQQDLEQGHATAVGREGVANAHPAVGRADPASVLRRAFGSAAGRARRIVLGGVA